MAERQTSIRKKAGSKPKFDYTGKTFLEKISELARRGYTDMEIAFAIGLNKSTFSEKKSEHPEIAEALSNARAQVNSIVRAAFLKSAIGGRLVRTTQYVQRRCECKGQDPKCPICDGLGWITPDQHKVVTEVELAPNLQAQNRWLMNYDPDWKKKVNGIDEETEDNTVDGYDIEVTFNRKGDLELQERVKKKE